MPGELKLYNSRICVLYVAESTDSTKMDGGWICTTARITMAMDTVQTANVLIGSGFALRSGEVQVPETLLSRVLRSINSDEPERMLACELWEVGSGAEIPKDPSAADIKKASSIPAYPPKYDSIRILKGYISSGTIEYSPKHGQSTKGVHLSLVGSAIKLMRMPIGELSNVSGAYILSLLRRRASIPGATSDQNSMKSDVSADIIKDATNMIRWDNHTIQTSIRDRLSDIISAILYAKSHSVARGGAGSRDGIRNLINGCLDGNIRLSDLIPESKLVSESYDLRLIELLKSALGQGSIYQGLYRIITSTEFMLRLRPGWNADDFKMCIDISHAWDSANGTIKLPLSSIRGLTFTTNPVSSMNTPDVFIVAASDLINSILGASSYTDTYYIGGIGVHCQNNSIAELFRTLYNDPIGITEDALKSTANYNAEIYHLPKWLAPALKGKVQKSDTSKGASSYSKLAGPDTPNEATASDGMGSGSVDPQPINDAVARTLFSLLYGKSMTCHVAIAPSMRFGGSKVVLEENLGKLVDIKFESSTSSELSIRGVLESLTYEYTSAGDGRSMQLYSANLSYVRALTDNEPSVLCDIYEDIKR